MSGCPEVLSEMVTGPDGYRINDIVELLVCLLGALPDLYSLATSPWESLEGHITIRELKIHSARRACESQRGI